MTTTTTWVLASEALDDGALALLRMEAVHALSRLFEVVVELQAAGDDDVVQSHLDALLVERAYVAADSTTHDRVWGVLRSIELITTEPGARPTYRAVLVPRLWYATQTRRSRVFQDATVPEIAGVVLDALGMHAGEDYVLRLTTAYPRREYVVQYEESDYAFLSRLLEDEGIAFRFEHGAERETLVLTDSNTAMRRPESASYVRFHTGTTAVPDAVVLALTHQRNVVPREVLLADYDWRKPSVELLSPARVDELGRGLVFSGAQHYRDGAYGRRLAQVRAEELLVGRSVFRGRSTIAELRAGDVLGLHGHFRPELDGDYLVLEVRRKLDQRFDGARAEASTGAENEFVAIAADVVYRPPRSTPRPRIDGVLYATVDGPEVGTPAPIDEQGRYKVVLPFDLAAQTGGRASRWIRMAQPLSGPGFGVHFPLREGAEVVLSHVQGDPDRPIIVGAVPNTQTPSPVTRGNATQSVIRTSSGIHMEFEDDA